MIGIHSLPAAQYRAADGLSKSDLDMINKSPSHFAWSRSGKGHVRKETDAMRFGTAVHTAVLEYPEFEKRYCKANGRRKNADDGKNSEGLIELTPADFDTINEICESISRHPTCEELLSGGAAEQSAFWYDHETMLIGKCRPDYAKDEMLIDLKTTTDATPRGFIRSVDSYRYHVQAAWYMDGWNSTVENSKRVVDFIFIAIEKTPPYAIGVYRLPDWKIEEGRNAYRTDLRVYEQCLVTDQWPGYPEEIITLRF